MTNHDAPGPRENVWLPWAAAVLLFVVSLALAWQVARLTQVETGLRDRLDRMKAPRANVPVVHLDPVTPSQEVSGSRDFVVLVLTPETADEFAEYRLEVTDAAGETLHEVRGLEPSDRGTLRLGLSDLPEGEYEVTLWGLTEDVEDPTRAGDYRLRVW